MTDEPTLGEVVRHLNRLAEQLDGIVDRLERRDHYIEENFVRTRVWVEARKADQAMSANLAQDIGALQENVKIDAAWRRQVMLTLAGVTIASLVSIALAVVNLR